MDISSTLSYFFGVEQLEASPCIIFGIVLIGIFLAYVTDEQDYWFQSGFDIHSSPESVKKYTPNDNSANKKPEQITTLLFKYLNLLTVSVCNCLSHIVSQCAFKNLNNFRTKINLYLTARQLKKIATSKRHFFYLLEKKTLNLEIRPDETEIDSYLECKHAVGKSWPFMWTVSDVNKSKVNCDGYECVPMSSYSYLNLLHNVEVQEAAITAAKQWATGNHGPRMLGGNMKILCDLEQVIADFFYREATLLCATGYLATMSAVAAIGTESAVIFADSRLHASLRAGLKIGEAKCVYFKHNNFKECEKLVLKHRKKYLNAWLVVESVYSMDGDICDLPSANALVKKYNMHMIIDEAHGLGVLGKTGRGIEEHFDLMGCATLIVGTFSKSVASVGGYITGPKKYISYFDFHAPGNVFSAPLPAYCAGAAIKSFEIINKNPSLVINVQKNSKYFRSILKTGLNKWPEDFPESHKYIVEGDEASSVIPLIFPDDIDRVMRVATKLKKKGFMCSAVAYPACNLRTPRFRITVTTAYTQELMDSFVSMLVDVCIEESPSTFAQALH